MMMEQRARQLLSRAGAILDGHFVGTNGNHLSVYVAKDRATRLTSIASELCAGIAERFAADDIEVVVAPAVGGIALSQWTAHHLSRLRPDRPEVLALYSEHEDEVWHDCRKPEGEDVIFGHQNVFHIETGEQVILRGTNFVLKRGFAEDVRGKRALEVEDILTTGGSALRTAKAISAAGGILVGLGVLANGGYVTPKACGVERLEALMVVDRKIYTEAECASANEGLCAKHVPINIEFGHGKAFLARKGQK